eukprot:TRINITY_DN2102_c0_g1_i16.p1 TRINITY_DN2102_c0_g1~~TRINITY_DN2102_c0_g1_i16.p1  ORF type:complete len:361 (-),score=58.34 TRINITY_DN2102_c0_g1_i16:336-1418(-)
MDLLRRLFLFFAVSYLLSYMQGVRSVVPDGYCAHQYPTLRVEPNYPLKHLTVIMRHGDRAPIEKCWPNQPSWLCTLAHQERQADYGNRLYTRDFMKDRNVNPGNCSSGQLTEIGLSQHIQNGIFLKKLYGDDLPLSIDPSTTYLRSTDVPRTFLSVEALLYGLYPPEEGCSQERLTIHTMDEETETMIPNSELCSGWLEISKQYESSPQYQKFQNNIWYPLERDVEAALGFSVGDSLIMYFDCVQAVACHNLPFPNAFTQELYDRITSANMYQYALNAFFQPSGYRYNAIQIAMASFINEVITKIDSVARNESEEKLAIFSGHDVTVLPFVLAYGVWDNVWPAYASLIRIELLEGCEGVV